MNKNIADIANHLGARDTTEAAIQRRIFKSTLCGCSSSVKDSSVHGTVFSVAGYCEGTDRYCEPHELVLPCYGSQLDAAIAEADQDGCDLWKETHGCEHCWPDGYCDEWGNEWTPDGDNWVGQPTNPECVTCEGQGIII